MFMYYFERQQNRKIVALETTVPFDFSDEVAEAWGFSLDAVDVLDQGDETVYEVYL